MPLRFLLPVPLLYLGLLAQAAAGSVAAGAWMPNGLLLVAALVARRPAGPLWAAVAGLLWDALSGRPLGVTMLPATLAAGFAAAMTRPASVWTRTGGVFLFVGTVEAAARLTAASVRSGGNLTAELAAAAGTAVGTAAVALVLLMGWSVTRQILATLRHDRRDAAPVRTWSAPLR